jgi:hypothetical protein
MMPSMNGTGTERAIYKLIAPAAMIFEGRRSGRNACLSRGLGQLLLQEWLGASRDIQQ